MSKDTTDKFAGLPGNAGRYSFDMITPLNSSPLRGKKICVLGSSVVNGAASCHWAVAEYLAKRFDCGYTKSAVDGTTLTDSMPRSYIERLHALDTKEHYDLFICQLSTNDATLGNPLGEISSGDDPSPDTITGGIEHIIRYARETWHCPVLFFTGSYYNNENYAAMVSRLMELRAKYGIGVIDLWHGTGFNSISDEARALYMYDGIHPTMAGYRDWWGPEIERQLLEYLEKCQ